MLRVERHAAGRRLWLFGWRVHHAHAGAALIVWGAWWLWRDRRDFPWI